MGSCGGYSILAEPAAIELKAIMTGSVVRTTAQPPPNRISSLFLFVTVFIAPFPFGSTDHAPVALWCAVLGIAIISASTKLIRRQHFMLIGLAILVIVAYAFVVHEQLAVKPWIASPHELWGEAARVLGDPIEPSVSVARNQPFFSLGAPLANMLAVVCSFIVCIDRYRARQLFLVVAWSGVVYAVYGIAAYLVDPTHVLWREKIAYRDVLTSTFVNRNTAAVYFGSCAVLWLLRFCQSLRQHLPSGQIYWRGVPRRLLSDLPRSVVLSLAMLLLCLAATLMTNSRAGILLSLATLILTFVIFFRRDLPKRGGVIAAFAIGGLVALLTIIVLGGNVVGRIETQGFSDEGRLETYKSTLKMIADYPWFGTGLGTFVWNFPAYRSANVPMWGVFDRAHSTPLELASDLGLPLAFLIFSAWVGALLVLLHGIKIRRRGVIFPIGAFSVAALAISHSTIDFSLQIPGYSITVFALVGAGLAQSFSGISIHKALSA